MLICVCVCHREVINKVKGIYSHTWKKQEHNYTKFRICLVYIFTFLVIVNITHKTIGDGYGFYMIINIEDTSFRILDHFTNVLTERNGLTAVFTGKNL